MSVAEISLSKETANDETASIAAVYVGTGATVTEDQLLFDVESSKATQEIRAPTSGILDHGLVVGQTVDYGISIARILPADQASAASVARPAAGPSESVTKIGATANVSMRRRAVVDAVPANQNLGALAPDRVPQMAQLASGQTLPRRFSKAAAALMAEYGVEPTSFDTDFVTTAEVRARVQARKPAFDPPKREPLRINRRKRAEIDALTRGAGSSMLSVLGITIGEIAVQRTTGAFLQGRIIDLVIYESSRLLTKYVRLNAAYRDGTVLLHDAVHAGLAIDGGGRLLVYGIENADRVSFSDLSDTIADAVGRYFDNALTTQELSRATFTVTDLSEGNLDFVLPLLPAGQSCILGITRDAGGAFRLFAGFDHRVTEGREVAMFLGELRDRLVSFSAAPPASTAHCAYCDRSATEAVDRIKDKGLLQIVDRSGRSALCCASCWNGW